MAPIMEMNAPLDLECDVSVLMAVHNGEKYLAEAIESILSQTYDKFEFVIVNDGSRDATARIIEKYRRLDSRIIVCEGAHAGLAASLNRGLAKCRGKLIARMDADDVSRPQRLEKQIAAFSSRPSLVALGTGVTTIGERGSSIRRRGSVTGAPKIAECLLTRNVISHPSAMIRKPALEQIGRYREKFRTSQDYDLWLRLLAVGEIDNLEEELLLCRKHAGRISDSRNASRQTLFSVAAITDHYLRNACMPVSDEPLGEDAPALLAGRLTELLNSDADVTDRKPLLRHAIRLLRYVQDIPANNRVALLNAMRPYLGIRDRIKMRLYRL
jgi:glycosyltransferase involved in cell wall biosynthesis